MPYKTEKLKIDSPFLDKRCKLLPCQKEMVFYWRERGLSLRELAKLFKVSKRLIQFTLDENKLKENKKRRDERGGSKIYYEKEKHNNFMKTHRRYKHKILKHTVTKS